MATATNDKPVRLGDLPVIKTNILENARQYDKGIIGGYNGIFPLTAAIKGNIYLLPTTNKFYMCITDYNGSNLTAPNANFEELSVWANRDKLENLSIKKLNAPYGYHLYLLKVDNNIGIIFGDKWKSDCNYVDTSKYFSSIYTANFSSSVSNPINTDFYICQFQESLGTTALFNALKVFENGTAIKLYSPEPSTSNFCSCSFTIVGQLIE